MTTIDMTNDYERQYAQVIFLKPHLRMCMAGMSPRPPLTKTKLMETARELTGAKFGNRDYEAAIEALNARRDTLLTYLGGASDG